MIWPLFKANIKSNRFIWILMTAIFCFYLLMIIVLYDPEDAAVMNELLQMFPEEIIKAFGFDNMGTTLLEFISGYINGMLIFLFPMVVSIVINHRLFASLIDRGSMAYLLATPNSRIKIAVTQAIFSIVSIFALFLVTTLFTIFISITTFPGELEVGKLILVNLYGFIMYIAIGGIGFFASAIASESKHSLAIGVGLPIGFFILQMLGNISDKISWMGKLSMYALFDPQKMIELNWFAFFGMGMLLVIGLGLYSAAIHIFNKRNLYV